MNDIMEPEHETPDCGAVDELLSAYFDEELNESADAFVRRHLDDCAACTARLEEIKATVDAIGALPRTATPEQDLWPGIIESAAAGGMATDLPGIRQRPWYTKPALLAAALAAFLVPGAFAVAGSMLLRGGDRDEPAPTIVVPVPPAPPRVLVAPRRDAPNPSPNDHVVDHARLEAMLVAIQDRESNIRRTAAMALGEYQDQRAIEALVEALRDDPDDDVRRWAAWALGEIGDRHAVDALSDAVESDHFDEARRWSAWALGEIGDPQAAPALGRALEDDHHEVRRWAAWALGEIESPAANDALGRALERDDSAEVRRWAAWALGEIEDPSGVQPLTHALEHDESAEVRRWSAWALGQIADPSAAESLLKAMMDENADVRQWAIRALSELRN